MPKSYTDILYHSVFSTKERRSLIRPEFKDDLFAYMGGIVRELGGKALIINGVDDHVHMLISFPAHPSLRDAMRVIKTNSSRWLHKAYPRHRDFSWQVGYGGFTVSRSAVPKVIRYIERQEEHHKKMDFKTEFIRLLKAHGVAYDERYIWD